MKNLKFIYLEKDFYFIVELLWFLIIFDKDLVDLTIYSPALNIFWITLGLAKARALAFENLIPLIILPPLKALWDAFKNVLQFLKIFSTFKIICERNSSY